ncbi:cell division protein FtsK, partial [Bacillus thuringiensis]
FKTDRLTEIQVPYISNETMWNVLKQYEVEKHEHTNTHQIESSDDDSDLD